MTNASESADSTATFGNRAMPAIAGGSESSARLEDSDTSRPTIESASSGTGSSGDRGRNRRSRALSGDTPQVLEETELQLRSRSSSRIQTAERPTQSRSISPRNPFQRSLPQSISGKGTAKNALPAGSPRSVPMTGKGVTRPGACLPTQTLSSVQALPYMPIPEIGIGIYPPICLSRR